MRMPHLNLSPATMSNSYGHYLLVRLQAVPEVAPILEYFLTVRGSEQDETIRTRLEPFRAQLTALGEALAAYKSSRDGSCGRGASKPG